VLFRSRLLVAGAERSVPDGEGLDTMSGLVRATLTDHDSAPAFDRLGLSAAERAKVLERARERLPDLLAWLEQNGRELLERT